MEMLLSKRNQLQNRVYNIMLICKNKIYYILLHKITTRPSTKTLLELTFDW